ncbi:MAG: hypothetical protein L0Y42_16345 [Phycisphaerales bacterium]|nr:hypothetical protein [Phycisphaerales bacterium]
MTVAVFSSLTAVFAANAEVAEFTNRAEWVSAIGGFEQMQTISFFEYPQGTLLNDQYTNLGVTFPDGNDFIISSSAYLLDGVGATSLFGPITLEFDEPRISIGVHFPGFLIIKLYSEGSLIYTSNEFGVGGAGFFGGLIATQAFDAAELIDPAGGVSIDTVHFGLPVPAPGGLALLSIAGLVMRRSRRR